jgi:hypothetical protein
MDSVFNKKSRNMTKGNLFEIFQRLEKPLAIFVLIPFIFMLFTIDADSRRRRSYKPDQTREQAIKIIRASSEELCELAGLEPINLSDDITKELEEQNELFDVGDDDDSEIADEELVGEEVELQVCIPDSVSEDIVQEDLDVLIEAEEEEILEDQEISLDMETFRTLWLDYVDDGGGIEYTEGGISKQDIMNEIMDWLGTPYRFGGTSRKAIDCSAFVQSIFFASSDIMLPRTARYQYTVGTKISRDNLEFGDMIFFHTYTRRFPSHVGIYLGDDLFAHASSKYGVTVSSLNSRYYSNRFIGGKRLMLKDINRYGIHTEEDKSSQ